MEQVSYVVVFPTAFSRNRMPLLVSNIKRILVAQNQRFRSVKRDGDVILVDANDPVFASSAINLLFGIDRIAIARQTRNDFREVVSGISSVGGSLLLRGERFLVRVEGFSRGFLPADVALAATSEIIEKRPGLGARPGTEHNHDKLLYAYLTRKNAYICIFSDGGNGGVPFEPGGHDAACCIYDELSAVSCYETMKQGLSPKIVVCYRTGSELTGLAKIVNRILPRLLREDVEVEVFRAGSVPAGKGGYGRLVMLALEILIGVARSRGIPRVSVPVSPLAFPAEFVDGAVSRVFDAGKIPVTPLSGLGSGVFADARELGLGGSPGRLARPFPQKAASGFSKKELDAALASRQAVSLSVGPNNVHDFLDSLGER